MALMTNVRAGRAAALIAAYQLAKGIVVDDFSSDTRILWTRMVRLDVDPDHSLEDYMTSTLAATQDERFDIPSKPVGTIHALATPDSVDFFLKSNWGEGQSIPPIPPLFTPQPVNYFLKHQVSADRWLTLGLVENVVPGGPGYFARILDAWCHRLALLIPKSRGPLMIRADYAGSSEPAPVSLASLGGVTLPTSYAKDQQLFDGASTVATIDPDGTPIVLAPSFLEVTFDQGLVHEWSDYGRLWEVHKAGRARVTVELKARVSDETWGRILASRAGTFETLRIVTVAPTPAPAKTLTLDFHSIKFKASQIGHQNLDALDITLKGEASIDGSGNFVGIVLE